MSICPNSSMSRPWRRWSEAVAIDPNEAMSYAVLAEVLSRMGRSEDALEAAAQALRLKPVIAD